MTTNFSVFGDELYATAISTQAMSIANTNQELDFGAPKCPTTWTHTTDTGVFTCRFTSRYLCKITVWVECTSGTAKMAGLRALFNGVEISGSHAGIDIPLSGEIKMLVSEFQFDGVSGQDLKIEIAGNDTVVQVVPGPNPGSASAVTSASIGIMRRP